MIKSRVIRCVRSYRYGVALGILAGAATLAVAMLSASSGTGNPKGFAGPIFASEATSYSSLSGLDADATSVAVLRATSNTSSTSIGPVPFRTTTMVVVENLAQASLPQTIVLRQLGPATNLPVVTP